MVTKEQKQRALDEAFRNWVSEKGLDETTAQEMAVVYRDGFQAACRLFQPPVVVKVPVLIQLDSFDDDDDELQEELAIRMHQALDKAGFILDIERMEKIGVLNEPN